MLERFANRYPEHAYEVELDCPEFTCLCPVTSQPDFARLTIRYCPGAYLVESKSLKLYLFSFRNQGTFSEDAVNRIAADLFALLQPHCIPERGVLATYRKLERPNQDEGFDALHYVRAVGGRRFIVEEWRDEL